MTDEKSCKNIHNHYISDETTNSVKLSNLIMNKVNGYIKESNGNKCSTLVSADESREALKKYKEI